MSQLDMFTAPADNTLPALASRMPKAHAASFLRSVALCYGRRFRNMRRGLTKTDSRLITWRAGWDVAIADAQRYSPGPIVPFDGPSDGLFRYSREVANPHWPALGSHGIWIRVEPHDRRFFVECEVYLPDTDRTQVVWNRFASTLPVAEAMARRWVVVGESVLGACL